VFRRRLYRWYAVTFDLPLSTTTDTIITIVHEADAAAFLQEFGRAGNPNFGCLPGIA